MGERGTKGLLDLHKHKQLDNRNDLFRRIWRREFHLMVSSLNVYHELLVISLTVS